MNADAILLESRQGLPLTEANRLKLVDHVARFLLTNYGQYPNSFVKTMMAKAVIALFPCQRFKESQSDGIVSVQFSKITKNLHILIVFTFERNYGSIPKLVISTTN